MPKPLRRAERKIYSYLVLLHRLVYWGMITIGFSVEIDYL